MKQFEVKLSRPLAWVTVIFTVFLVCFMAFLFTLVGEAPLGLTNWLFLALFVFIFVLLGYFAVMQPMRLELTDSKLIIVRVYGKVEIKRSEVVEVYRKKNLWMDIKVLGDAGWFGYIGLFWNKREGLHHNYVKNLSKAVVVRTNKTYYIVSCEHPGDLIHELKKTMHVL